MLIIVRFFFPLISQIDAEHSFESAKISEICGAKN
jgi:hypothetical protein